MFMGEYRHNIDDKNRLIIPSKHRSELGNEVVITRGLDKCLFVYPKETWEKITSKLNELPFTKSDARRFNRFFLSGATLVEFDKTGRINIATPLIEYANILKECVIIGVGDRLEIWSQDGWNEFFTKNEEDMSDIAENLFTGNIDF